MLYLDNFRLDWIAQLLGQLLKTFLQTAFVQKNEISMDKILRLSMYLILGRLASRLYGYLQGKQAYRWAVLIYTLAVTRFILPLTSSAFLNATQHLFVYLIPILVAIWYIRNTTRPTAISNTFQPKARLFS
jgi:hypothetical protein